LSAGEETSFPGARPEDRNDLARVSSYYVDVNGRSVLRDRLRQILDRDYASGPLHEFLASLDTPQVIVSTNYDTLIERAFLAAKRPFDLVVYSSDNKEYANSVLWWPHGAAEPKALAPNQLDIDLDTTTVIFKMHGTVDRDGGGQWDNYVITEEDYIEFLSRLTTNAAIPAIFSTTSSNQLLSRVQPGTELARRPEHRSAARPQGWGQDAVLGDQHQSSELERML
jgi:hypothetical protein